MFRNGKNKILQRLISFVFVVVLFLFALVPGVKAQEDGTWYDQSFSEWSTKVFESPSNEIFGERYTFAQVQWIFYSLSSIAVGSDLLKCSGPTVSSDVELFKSCVENLAPAQSDSQNQTTKPSQTSLVGLAQMGDALLSTRVASGVEYLANKASDLHIIPSAKAQGIGFKSLEPVQVIWKAFRNMAYFLSIVVILVMAFMIMFRIKISPQTVITIQSSIPKLMGILILITFSYAIAGLIIDLSYLILAIFALFIKSQGLAGSQISTVVTPLDSIQLARVMWSGVGGQLSSIVILTMLPIIIIFTIGGFALGGTTGVAIPVPVIGSVAGAGIGVATAVVLLLIIGAIVLWTLIRIFWTMLKASINIILLVIFGPLLILLGGISNNLGVGVWLRNLAANVVVFPTISLMAFLAHLIYWSRDNELTNFFRSVGWLNIYGVPGTMSGYFNLPGFLLDTFLMPILVALGLLFMMPAAADLIKSIVQGQPFNYGTAIGQALAPARMAWGTTGGPMLAQMREYSTAKTTIGIARAIEKSTRLPASVTGSAKNYADSMENKLGIEKPKK